jgi:hypothetical protein
MDSGTLSRTQAAPPSPKGVDSNGGMSAEEQTLLLDLGQLALDLAGILDPTPISDGTNAVISLGRGDWWGAGLSGVATIPYVGDLAKAGKLGRWAQTVHKTINLARLRPAFALKARPVLEQLALLSARIPYRMLPDAARNTFLLIQRELRIFMGHAQRLPRKQMVDAFLTTWFKTIDDLPLTPPGMHKGALWAKLGAKAPVTRKGSKTAGWGLHGDDPSLSAEALALRLAKNDGKQTLASLLDPELIAKISDDAKTLSELVGEIVDWAEFEQKVWTHLSLKYVRTLQGRVVVYVDDLVLKQALQEGETAILTTELQLLYRRFKQGDGIHSIEVRDIYETKGRLAN